MHFAACQAIDSTGSNLAIESEEFLLGLLHFPSDTTGLRNILEQDYLLLTKFPGLLSPHTGASQAYR